MEFLTLFGQMFTQVDVFLTTIARDYGAAIYLTLFAIYFCETGLVFMAFLPGDSLLFVAGAVAATGAMDAATSMLAVILGASIGNVLNWTIGSWLGGKVYDGSISWIDQEALNKTHTFYERHGGKTIFLARFVPIVRSFAPLVAGSARMPFPRFFVYSLTGAVAWAVGLIGLGYLFGNIPFIRDHLTLILLLGIACALGPFLLITVAKFLQNKLSR